MSPPDKGRRRGAACSNTHIFQGGTSATDPASSLTSSAGPDAPLPPRVPLPSSSEDQRKSRSRRGSNTPSTRSVSTSIASMSTTAAAETFLRDKDMRIAQLERELAKESETASFWQAKHSALNQQFLRTDTELRLLRDDRTPRQEDTDDPTTRGWRDVMESEMADKDKEIRALRSQVRGLKEWVSTSTRADGTASVSDEVFGQGWARLGNGLQNWVITNFRKAKVDLSRADEVTLKDFAELVPMHEELLAQGAKAQLLQSLVSRILAQRIFGAYFVGLMDEQEEQMKRTEQLMATFVSAEAVNQWRSVTLSILKKEAAERMQGPTTQAIANVISSINGFLDTITVGTTNVKSSGGGNEISETRDQALRQLIANSIELSRLFVVQKAAFEVWMPEIMPHQRVLFDHATMEDIGGEDEESLVQREICCVTFPGVIKRGDENGSQLQFRNVISKARVLCGPQ
ncbi:hypothetical protein N0V82_001918 [Gnomoniopsis sp. IMI 355080]|nr:hypothetical protein N0V82_001918 [Gnomoniopsis sp. IMI 355080]